MSEGQPVSRLGTEHADRATDQGIMATGLAWASAFVALLALPITMVLANKSAPAVLGLAALLANSSVLAGYGSHRLMQGYLRAVDTGTGRALAALLALALLSLAWTIDPAISRRGLIEALPELVFGWGLAAAWPLVFLPASIRLLLIGLFGAAVLILLEGFFGMPLHKLLGARAESYDLKRSAIPLVLLLWPMLTLLMRHRRRWLSVALVVVVGLAAAAAHSAASVVALLLGLTVLAAGLLIPRVTYVALGLAAACLLLATPWTGTIAGRLLSPGAETMLQAQHARHRVQIWTAFERHIRDKHLTGHGFDTSFRVADIVEGVASTFGPSADKAIDNIHPHNVLLQVWIEFGVLGAAVTAVGLVFVFARLGRMDPRQRAWRLAFLVSAACVALVGLNAWSPWWLAVLALCLALFRFERDSSAAPSIGAR